MEIEVAKPKSRGHPASNTTETRFAIVLILQDRDRVTFGAGFPGFGCAERVVLVVMMAINFRCVGDEICREGWGCPEDAVRPWGWAFRDLRS